MDGRVVCKMVQGGRQSVGASWDTPCAHGAVHWGTRASALHRPGVPVVGGWGCRRPPA